jgi:hypothetical protein
MSLQTNHVSADVSSEISRLYFIIRAALSGVRTSVPVQVLSVTNSGGVSQIGKVTVQILVNAIDGAGVAWPHGPIANVPYMRIQGGSNAVILDPQVGDIGIASVCDRDISSVKNSGVAGNPGSTRKHDISDMVYLMTIIGAAPTQYVQFNASGISVVSPTKITLAAPTVEMDAPNIILNGALQQGQGSNAGNATMGGTLTVQTDVKLASGTTLGTHDHNYLPGTGAQTKTSAPNTD